MIYLAKVRTENINSLKLWVVLIYFCLIKDSLALNLSGHVHPALLEMHSCKAHKAAVCSYIAAAEYRGEAQLIP